MSSADGTTNKSLNARTGHSDVSQLRAQLAEFLFTHVKVGQHLLLALSGGLDSRVLLDLLVMYRPIIGYQLSAVHVHHGLSPNADQWAEFCAAICQTSNVPFKLLKVHVDRSSGKGVEAAARDARYQALMDERGDHVLLAHHQDDQAETLLLQLLRGAGAKGMAAMPPRDIERRLLRPLLEVPRACLRHYAEEVGLEWIEDESNLDQAYDRNFIRNAVMPKLEQRFHGARKVLARTAAHMAETTRLLDDLAEIDANSQISTIQALRSHLPLELLRRLTEARARNLLRWWLTQQGLEMPSAARLTQMLKQLLSARQDATISVKLSDRHTLRRYRDQAYLTPDINFSEWTRVWKGESELMLPNHGVLKFEHQRGEGLALGRLGIKQLIVTQREGGERFRPDAARPTRTLKHLLQEAQMPPWERAVLPLIYWNDTLACVPGVGVAADLQAGPDEQGLTIRWHHNQ